MAPPAGAPLPTVLTTPTPAPGGAAGTPGAGGATPAPGEAPAGPVLSVVPPPAILDEAQTATVPLIAYDETAKPGHQYKYRMRVEIYNPAYHADEKLEKGQEALNNQPVLVSAWSDASPVLSVEPDQTFYVAAVKQWAANFKIWQLINAKWEHADVEVPVGDVVGEQKDSQFATDYLVVDSMAGRVVLMNTKDGKLEVRDVGTDEKAADKRTQKDKEQETTDAAATAPKPAN